MNYAQTFLMTNSSNFPAESIPMLQKEISELDEQSINGLLMTELKNPTTALIFAILFGEYGVDRFYNKDTGLGVAKLALTVLGWLTSWILIGFLFLLAVYVWKIVDCFMIMGAVRQGNLERLMANIQLAKNIQNRQQVEPTVERSTPSVVAKEEPAVPAEFITETEEVPAEEAVEPSSEVAVAEEVVVVEEVVETPETVAEEATETLVEVGEEVVVKEAIEPVSEEIVPEEVATDDEATEPVEG